MSLFVFFVILGAALLHASWNALVRAGTSKTTTMVILTLVQGGFGLVIALTRDLPERHVWIWLLASGAFHAAYKIFLAFAYENGDLSRVYPIARGAAPLIVLVVSVFLIAEALATHEILSVMILGAGVLLMGHGAFQSGEDVRLVPLALASATMTAGYSVVDGLGARVSGDAVMFVAWLFVLDAMLLTPVILALCGRAALQASPRGWALGAGAAVLSYCAYAIAVWAMTVAPIALVTALRETSILFAMLIGYFFLGERMDDWKMTAGLLILLGLVLVRL